MMALSRRRMLGGLAASAGLGLAGAPPALAQARKISLGYTATVGFAGAFVAKDRGFFASNGLDVDLTLVAINSNIPPALLSGSIEIGGPTPSVFLQATDGGLDLVVIAGCSGTDPTNAREGVLVPKGSPIRGPADFVGRRVGVPGLGAFFHVLFRQWLSAKGVDYNKVNFVEVAFTQSADVLRSGAVDAVLTGDPFASRIVAEGGAVAVPIYQTCPPGTPSIVYAATRDWARANAPAVKGFQLSMRQAVAFVADHPAETRESIAKFIKIAPDVLAGLPIPIIQAEVSEDQMRYWADMMAKQDMLQGKPDVARLIVR